MMSVTLLLQATLILSASCWGNPCSSSDKPGLCGFDQVTNLDDALALVIANLSLTFPTSGYDGSNSCNSTCFDNEVGAGGTTRNASAKVDEIIKNIKEITDKLEESINKTKHEETVGGALRQFRTDRDWLKLRDVVLRVLEPGTPAFQQASENNEFEEGESALLVMIHSDHKELLEILLDHGLDANMRWEANYATMLHEVAVTGNIKLAELLVSRGAFVDMRAKWEVTPLLRASASHQPEMVRWLLQHGADVNYTDSNGWTALHFAAKEDDPETAKILMDAGIDQDAVNVDGLTAFELAGTLQSSRFVKVMVPSRVFENEIEAE